ncbi:alpha/beta hydrolase [Paludibacter jiangxiensis]|uniref:Acetyl esterase n=1 Tax=Paludibacter jiangxiensis TaxID=681398 RepID=A0A161LF05_9BACT|nr:alpha/beta hydrolase [Paludibacter jiangxiensis]GAT63455.1 acetyl esterase [Paludibacter jiangxiensis]
MKKELLILFAFILVALPSVGAQEIIPLYNGVVPNSKTAETTLVKESFGNGMYRNVTTPTLEVFLPEKGKETGAAVVICPGGGYSVIVYSGEGVMNAKELAKNGVAAFVLKYRLPDDAIMNDKSIGPLQDAQQAIKVVRENAAKWGVNPNKIGIMGFSAGGHLASTEATHFKKALIDNANNTSLRPDFQVVVYPVISMQEKLTHRDSRTQLLGNSPKQETVDLFSNELQVDATAPPAYITHAADDRTVDVDNSIGYFEALRHNKVPVEMHIYPKGGHGFVFRQQGWMEPLLKWIESTTSSAAK